MITDEIMAALAPLIAAFKDLKIESSKGNAWLHLPGSLVQTIETKNALEKGLIDDRIKHQFGHKET